MRNLILALTIAVLTPFAFGAEIFTSTDAFSNGFTEVMNANIANVKSALEERFGECADIARGTCKGHTEYGNDPRTGKPYIGYHGYCSIGGNNCELNSDAGWGIMVEGIDDKMSFVRIYKDYEEL